MFRRKDDILLKSAVEDFFPDFLRFYLADQVALFDLEKGYTFLNKELQEIMPEVQHPGGTRFADLLVRLWLKEGKEEWILVHIEIQGSNDATFARRMFTYYYRVLDKFNVPVTAFAIFTGGPQQQQPAVFQQSFLGTTLTYEYNAFSIFQHTEAQLLAMHNPFAYVILAAQKALLSGRLSETELAAQRWLLAKTLIASKLLSHERIIHFMHFLKNMVQISNLEINAIFDRQVDLLMDNVPTMGILETLEMFALERGHEQGLEQGLEQGEAKLKSKEELIVINLITELGLTDEQVTRIAAVPIELVQAVRQKLL